MQPYFVVPSPGSDPADEWVRLGIQAHMDAQAIADPQQRLQRFAGAEGHYRKALRQDPRSALATLNLGILYAQLGNLNEGLLTVERAAMFDGVCAAVHANRALMCLDAERTEEALAAARHAREVSPKFGPSEVDKAGYMGARLALAMVAGGSGLAEEAIEAYGEMVAADPKGPAGQMAAANSCFAQTLTFCGTEELCRLRKAWRANNEPPAELKGRPHPNGKNPDRPLRVGYVGGDFKQHSASMIFANVVLNHGPECEVYLYSSLPVDPATDPMTKDFQAKAGPRWRDISAKTDDEAAEMVRADKIDVLVDLAAHTGGGRLPVFCRRPAPVQATAWGFAHGTGVPEIDAFLADPVVLPEEERKHFAERRIVDLPCAVTYWPGLPERYGHKAFSVLPAYKNDCVTFGCFSRYEKISDECLRTFAEVLKRVPDSRMAFKDSAFRRPSCIRRVQALMPGLEERLLFYIHTTHPDNLLDYQQVDLVLNPFPHSSGVVCMEQLYMGVPLVTLWGAQPGGRTAASVLTCMGRGDWVAKTQAEYVEIAARLAGDLPYLSKVRKLLRQELLESAVVKSYAAAAEAAYRELWKEYCAK